MPDTSIPSYLSRKQTSSRQTLAFALAVIFFIAAGVIFVILSYSIRQKEMFASIDRQLYIGATAIPHLLPGDFHDRAVNPDAISPAEDRTNITQLSHHAEKAGFAFLYTLLKTPDGFHITSSSASEEELEAGDEVRYFEAFPEAYPQFHSALEKNRPVSFTHTDRWGSFRATAIPLLTPSGRPYLAVAEYEISHVRSALRRATMRDLALCCLLLLAAVPMIWVVILRARRTAADRKKLLEESEKVSRLEALGRLAGGVAHDFNNLLTVMGGYVSLCKGRLANDHPILPWLDQIENAAERSAGLTRQLLAFARRQTAEPRVLQLNDAITDLKFLLGNLIGEDIELIWRTDADLWPVRIDPTQVEQIVTNLCVNARDAIAGVGRITLETANAELDEKYCAAHPGAEPGRYAMLTVSDTGCGMDRETIRHIFEPFFSTKEPGKGTGLGLATIHGIVKQNNGHISIYSEPGAGTTFRIYLPRFKGESEDAAPAMTTTPTQGGSETLMVVEDDESIRSLVHQVLESQGYTVFSAGSPHEALKITADLPGTIHLLVTDVIMPGMTGKDLAGRLAEIYPDMKCLYISGYTVDIISRQGVLEEDVHFIAKPFTIDVIERKVREVLDG